jgi:hypothetical protein
MKEIVSNPYYVVSVDPQKNCLYLTATGMWVDEAAVKGFVDDVKKALDELQRNLTIFIDCTGMEGTTLPNLFAGAQKAAMARGIRKVASVWSHESFFKLQAQKIAQTTGFPVERFSDLQEAQAWLDEP